MNRAQATQPHIALQREYVLPKRTNILKIATVAFVILGIVGLVLALTGTLPGKEFVAQHTFLRLLTGCSGGLLILVAPTCLIPLKYEKPLFRAQVREDFGNFEYVAPDDQNTQKLLTTPDLTGIERIFKKSKLLPETVDLETLRTLPKDGPLSFRIAKQQTQTTAFLDLLCIDEMKREVVVSVQFTKGGTKTALSCSCFTKTTKAGWTTNLNVNPPSSSAPLIPDLDTLFEKKWVMIEDSLKQMHRLKLKES